MAISDERLIAYADGELDAAGRAEVEAAIAADPAVANRLKAHRDLRARLFGAYAGALDEPIPEAWTRLATAPPSAQVVDLARERARRRATGRWMQWGAMAASLAAGLLLGRLVLPMSPQGLIAGTGSAMVARGALDRALTDQMASGQGAAPVKIGLSFRSTDNRYCRTFQARAEGGLAGLACREGDAWRVRVAIAATPAHETQYRTAGAETPAAVLSAVDAMISGEPLDARGEAAAKARRWRP
jgi:hypothetical protein